MDRLPTNDFPVLEVMTPGTGHLVGTRLPLISRPFTIGRVKDNALPVNSGLITRKHCEVVFEYDRWWVRDLGSTHGTFHLGERIHDAELIHGSVFELPGGVALRLLLRQPVDVTDEGMERAIIDQPDDDQRWSVYADWLQERGAPLGDRIANPEAAEDRHWLGPLAAFAAHDELEVDWAHGLPSRVVMRSRSPSPQGWEQRLDLLLAQSTFRFVRSLELDVASFIHEDVRASTGLSLMNRLGLKLLPLLERAAIGPCTPPADRQLLEAPLAARRKRFPRFATTPETFFLGWRPATLTYEGRVFPLPGTITFHVGPARSDLELATGCPAFGLLFVNDRWRLTADLASHGVKVNGVLCKHARLRPGDVIEPLPGTRLRFDA